MSFTALFSTFVCAAANRITLETDKNAIEHDGTLVNAEALSDGNNMVATWETQYCNMNGIRNNVAACKKKIQDEEAWCQKMAKSKNKFEKSNDKRCPRFNEDKSRAGGLKGSGKKAQHQGAVAKAAAACEPEVQRVCRETHCPTYSALTKKSAAACSKTCADVARSMWNTGSMQCDPKKSFAECEKTLQQQLKSAGRVPELEALLREQLLKCICVTRSADTRTCYEGTMGIPKGKTWCEFENTPSWRKLLATAPRGKTFPKAKCAKDAKGKVVR